MNIKLSIIVLVTFLTPTLCRILPKSDSDADSLLLIPKEPYLYQQAQTDQNILQQQTSTQGYPSCFLGTNIADHLFSLGEDNNNGQGSFGMVVISSINDKRFAFKMVKNTQENMQVLQNEITMLEKIKKVNVTYAVRYYGCYLSKYMNKIYIILQFDALYQTMQLTIKETDMLDEDQNEPEYKNDISNYFDYLKQERLNAFVPLFFSLQKFHANHIALNDIKPENIMTDLDLRQVQGIQRPLLNLFFIDFGSAFETNDSNDDVRGTPQFIHPQVYFQMKNNYPKKNDIYALCLSYFYIEYQVNSINEVDENGQLKITPLFDDEFPELQELLKLTQEQALDQSNQQIEKIRNKVWEEFAQLEITNKRSQETFDQDIEQLLKSQTLNDEQKANQLAYYCDYKEELVMYACLQKNIKDIPNTSIVVSALNTCLKKNNM